ncbi:hypothetical protein ACFSUD_09945 [Sulfitobacter aestuarii]|uniref:Alpha/beta hydrolase n=1 Tax=Sulfitobacter aestuarii TaxID=2161676 RepID=A0ABW5U3L8_9RHOB
MIARRAALALVALLALSSCNLAANYLESTEFRVAGSRLLMSGTITSATPRQFARVLAANPQITTLVERNVDGSVDDAAMIEMGYRLRRAGLDTHLDGDSQIFSGAVMLFLSGVERTMIRGAVIGVHSWRDSLRDGADYPATSPKHALNRRYVADMLGQDAFYWFTLRAAPSEGMYLLREHEIRDFGLLTRPIEAP